jgi:hypothetical protein
MLEKEGAAIADKMDTMAITTSNSISVKPPGGRFGVRFDPRSKLRVSTAVLEQ